MQNYWNYCDFTWNNFVYKILWFSIFYKMNTQNSDLAALWNWDIKAKWPFIENIAEAEI